MRKQTVCVFENNDADQLCSNCTADQRRCFRHADSKIPPFTYIQSFKLLTLFCDCTAWFVSDLVGNPNCLSSHAQAQCQRIRSILFCYDSKQKNGMLNVSRTTSSYIRRLLICLSCVFASQSTAMVMSGRCLHFIAFLPNGSIYNVCFGAKKKKKKKKERKNRGIPLHTPVFLT